MSAANGKLKHSQFTLRGLIAVTVVVAACLGYWQERTRRQALADRLDRMIESPLVNVWSPQLSDNFSNRADIAVAGVVRWPAKREPIRNLRVTLQLLKAEDPQVVEEMPGEVVFNTADWKYHFVNTFKRPRNPPSELTPGIYIVRAECFDANVSIATGISGGVARALGCATGREFDEHNV